VLFAGAAVWAEGFRDAASEREDRNAGKVMNGKVMEAGVVRTIERRMAQARPEVVILGNSLSNTNINTVLLAKRLGLRKDKVQKFSIPNSIGATWYVILKNRMYANGHEPSVVILLSDLQSALATTPRTEAAYVNLTVHFNPREPVVDRKLGTQSYFLNRLRENREKLRDKALKISRNAAVDMLYWRTIDPAFHGRTTAALERAFDQSRTDIRLHNNVIPTFSTGGELHPFDPSLLPLPKESFIPEITSMVEKHSGLALFLRPPMSPLLPDGAGDVVMPGVEEKTRRLVENKGGRYIDVRKLDMQAGHFYNIDHMNPEGARRFTEAVAMLVNQVQAESQGRAGWNRRPQPKEIELFTEIELRNDAVVHRQHRVDHSPKRPPAVPGANKPFERRRFDIGYFEAGGLGFMSDVDTLEQSRFAARCSPLRVLEDDVALEVSNATCEEMFRLRQGRICHTRERVFFTASDSSSPFENGSTYSLALDPERRCEGGTWLYPGDQFRSRFDGERLTEFSRGGRTLRIEAHDFGPKDTAAKLTVRLRVNGAVRVEEEFVPSQMRDAISIPVRPAVPGAARDVVLTVQNESRNFVLVTSAVLSERVDEGE
jgi:hypothetical protein